MLFNSLEFAFFLPIVFAIYWIINKGSLKLQNLLLLVASYFFYGWWDWKFLLLILFSSCVDYTIGLYLGKDLEQKHRKYLLWFSLFVNLGLLGVFKYFNFFIDSFVDAFSLFGFSINSLSLNVILPVGISFYTFQTLSYSIDVYKGKIEPTKDVIAFFAFVSFFPQLVAGPIERASNLLPQFLEKRNFNYEQAINGLRQVLWGFFKKLVVADNCAVYVNDIFANYGIHQGSTLVIAGILFAFQIYCDFSGYSDIAIGTAKLFGFRLMQNFAFPYFSRDIAEFWRRWHISLSTWFRDYVYIPLGGSRGSKWKKIRNTFIIFIVSGFWHGANWTFIFWGAINACYFLPLMLIDRNRQHLDIVAADSYLPSLREFLQIAITFMLSVLAWIFFRAETISDAFLYIEKIFTYSLFEYSTYSYTNYNHFYGIFVLLIVEWLGRRKTHALEFETERIFEYKPVRWILYIGILLMIFYLGNFTSETFIYFQF